MTDRPVLTINKGTPQIVANQSGDNYELPNLITADPVTADVLWENNGVLNINGGAPSVDPNYVATAAPSAAPAKVIASLPWPPPNWLPITPPIMVPIICGTPER